MFLKLIFVVCMHGISTASPKQYNDLELEKSCPDNPLYQSVAYPQQHYMFPLYFLLSPDERYPSCF